MEVVDSLLLPGILPFNLLVGTINSTVTFLVYKTVSRHVIHGEGWLSLIHILNVDCPACLIPETIAHEMAHQRMVASELEANFVGIAACVTCGDTVFQYSGYLAGLIQLCNALYPVAPDLWDCLLYTSWHPLLSLVWQTVQVIREGNIPSLTSALSSPGPACLELPCPLPALH